MTGAYQPYRPARRPGGKPQAKPRYRVLVHRKFAELWQALPQRVGVTSVQQFYDHVTHTPGQPAAIRVPRSFRTVNLISFTSGNGGNDARTAEEVFA